MSREIPCLVKYVICKPEEILQLKIKWKQTCLDKNEPAQGFFSFVSKDRDKGLGINRNSWEVIYVNFHQAVYLDKNEQTQGISFVRNQSIIFMTMLKLIVCCKYISYFFLMMYSKESGRSKNAWRRSYDF